MTFSSIVSIRQKLEDLEDMVMEVLHPDEAEWQDFSRIGFNDIYYWPASYLLNGHRDWPGSKFRVRGTRMLTNGHRKTVYVYGDKL